MLVLPANARIRQDDLLAGARGGGALRLLHGHEVGDIGQHRLQVRHPIEEGDVSRLICQSTNLSPA